MKVCERNSVKSMCRRSIFIGSHGPPVNYSFSCLGTHVGSPYKYCKSFGWSWPGMRGSSFSPHDDDDCLLYSLFQLACISAARIIFYAFNLILYHFWILCWTCMIEHIYNFCYLVFP